MIASENFTSEAVLEATGSVFTNKYAEGYPGKRYYGGCEHADVVENLARDRAKKLFKAEYANVQPHSGSQANQAAYAAVLQPGDTVLGMNLAHGGHLTHGHHLNFSGKTYKIVPYGVRKEDELIDYDELARLADRAQAEDDHRGRQRISADYRFQALPRSRRFRGRAVPGRHGALLRPGRGGLYPNPCEYADIVTSTTHKTLRGPRSGLILAREKYGTAIDKTVFPGTAGRTAGARDRGQGGLLPRSDEPGVRRLSEAGHSRTPRRSRPGSLSEGFRIVSGGTDTHLLLVDVFAKGMRGKEAEQSLDHAHITVNKNGIPFDVNPPLNPSGIRLGSPAVTTRGFGEPEMREVASCIAQVLARPCV